MTPQAPRLVVVWLATALLAVAVSVATGEDSLPTAQDTFRVRPGIATHVPVSQSDVNWLQCDGPISDIITSAERNVDVRYSGNNAFLKFKALRTGDETLFSEVQTEFYVVCNTEIYKLILEPLPRPATTITLEPSLDARVEDTLARFTGMPWEQILVQVIREAYSGDISPAYQVESLEQVVPFSSAATLTLTSRFRVPGEGLRVYTFTLTAGDLAIDQIGESSFLDRSLPVEGVRQAIAVEHHSLQANESTRVFLVTRVATSEAATPAALLRGLAQ